MRYLIILTSFVFLTSSCGESGNKEARDKQKMLETIEKQRKELREIPEDEKRERVESALTLISSYDNYSDDYPEDEHTPDFLFEAGRLSSHVLSDYEMAIDFYEQIADDYPEHERAPAALFTAAYLEENMLANKPKARLHYEDFIRRYPNHEFKKDADFALRVIDKDPSEILEEFKSREAEEVN